MGLAYFVIEKVVYPLAHFCPGLSSRNQGKKCMKSSARGRPSTSCGLQALQRCFVSTTKTKRDNIMSVEIIVFWGYTRQKLIFKNLKGKNNQNFQVVLKVTVHNSKSNEVCQDFSFRFFSKT